MKYIYRFVYDDNLAMHVFKMVDSVEMPVWDMMYPSYTEDVISGELIEDPTLIELKVMSSMSDTNGLSGYLKSIGVLQSEDSLIEESDYKKQLAETEKKEALSEAIEILKTKKSELDLPLYARDIDNSAVEIVQYIADQAQSPAPERMSIHAKEMLEKRFGNKMVALSMKAFPVAEYASGGGISKTTLLLPDLIAQQVATKSVNAAKQVKSLSTNQKSSIAVRLSDYLSDKANELFKRNQSFRNQVDGQYGREALMSYMVHWSNTWFKNQQWKFEQGGNVQSEYDRGVIISKTPGKYIFNAVHNESSVGVNILYYDVYENKIIEIIYNIMNGRKSKTEHTEPYQDYLLYRLSKSKKANEREWDIDKKGRWDSFDKGGELDSVPDGLQEEIEEGIKIVSAKKIQNGEDDDGEGNGETWEINESRTIYRVIQTYQDNHGDPINVEEFDELEDAQKELDSLEAPDEWVTATTEHLAFIEEVTQARTVTYSNYNADWYLDVDERWDDENNEDIGIFKSFGTREEDAESILHHCHFNLVQDISGDYEIDDIPVKVKGYPNHNGYSGTYNRLTIYDKDENEIGDIELRISNHSYNPKNNVGKSTDAFISVVIANKDATRDRFSGRYNLYFDGNNSYQDIVESVVERIREILDGLDLEKKE